MLLDNDDLEESLAITNMVTKLEAAAKEELFALDQRVGFLIGDTALERHENPFGPRVICDAARQACRQVQSGIEVKLIILKLFDKCVVSTAPALYQAMNDYLVQAAILPQIRRVVVRSEAAIRGAEAVLAEHSNATENIPEYGVQGSRQKRAAAESTAAGPGLDADGSGLSAPDLFATLRSIMAVNGPAQRTVPGAVQTKQVRRVLGDLTVLQRSHQELVGANDEYSREGALAENTTELLRQVKTAKIATGIGHVDDMMIDIVAMMFDYILDDDNLADSIKALIGRLQIPVLKVAILDKSFFSRKFHPARKLLNSIADAAIGWSEKHHGNDALYDNIEAIVHRILSEFEDDPSIFSELLQDFESFLTKQEQSREASSRESATSAEGREKLQVARTVAQDEVTRRISSQSVPEIIRSFLDTYWKGLLIVSYINGGAQADEWRRYIETMDDLVWSVSPKRTADERFKLVGLLPGLVKRLNEGMAKASMESKERDRFVAKLADYHAKAVKPLVEHKTSATVLGSRVATKNQADDLAAGGVALNDGSLNLPPSMNQLILSDGALGLGIADEFAGEDFTTAMRLVQSAISKANGLIFRTAQTQPQCKGMGTTLVAALFTENRVTIAHVGDSRLYRLRNDELRQITVDHSLQQELIQKGFYTPEEAKQSVNKNIVTRAVGVEPTVKPDFTEEIVREDDVFLLCSDGLSDLVTEQEMCAILQRFDTDLEAAAELLVKSANDKGGKDNISVVLARTLGAGDDTKLPYGSRVVGRSMRIVTRSDVGRKRSHNEDSVRADSEIGVAVLADGMGGYNAGEVASAIAVNLVADELRKALCSAAITGGDGGAHDAKQQELDEHERLDAHCLRELLDKADIEVEEITIQDVESGLSAPELVDEHTHAARNLEIGSWVEFRGPGEVCVRARLTWISSVTGAYLFTDRQGLKVADSTVHGLAVEFRRGTATIIDDVPLFDRAVTGLMERLKHSGSCHAE
ncbi:MAG: DUF1631 family protein [Gammaproteobacteria bacterium]